MCKKVLIPFHFGYPVRLRITEWISPKKLRAFLSIKSENSLNSWYSLRLSKKMLLFLTGHHGALEAWPRGRAEFWLFRNCPCGPPTPTALCPEWRWPSQGGWPPNSEKVSGNKYRWLFERCGFFFVESLIGITSCTKLEKKIWFAICVTDWVWTIFAGNSRKMDRPIVYFRLREMVIY